MNDTKQQAEPATIARPNPIIAHPHPTQQDWQAIPNGDPGIFQFTIVSFPALRNVAQVFAQRWKNHAKVEDDPEALAMAVLLAAAPKLYRAGKALADFAKRLNDLQHSGQEVDPSMWGELYQLVNEMRGAVEEAEVKP